MNEINWTNVSRAQLKALNDSKAIFIAASRTITDLRLLQLIKKYLVKANIVIGVANEPYVLGFENQSQFETLNISSDHKIISKVNNSDSPHKITILRYNQTDAVDIYKSVNFSRIILVNGSWQYSYHLRPEYAVLKDRKIAIKHVSPFASEQEAIEYANNFKPVVINPDKLLTEQEMMQVANKSAANSFDTSFQTGVSLGRKQGDKYELIDYACNTVVPFLTYAWHNGASRETYKCQPGDLNHYDAIHAEIMLILQAQSRKYDTKNATLFINLLPCRTCALALCKFDFKEIVYTKNHSEGFAVDLLEKAGKKVRRLKENEN